MAGTTETWPGMFCRGRNCNAQKMRIWKCRVHLSLWKICGNSSQSVIFVCNHQRWIKFKYAAFLFFVGNVRCQLSVQLKSEGRCRELSDGHFKVALVSFCGKIRHLTDIATQRVMTDREHFSANVYWSKIEMSANREKIENFAYFAVCLCNSLISNA